MVTDLNELMQEFDKADPEDNEIGQIVVPEGYFADIVDGSTNSTEVAQEAAAGVEVQIIPLNSWFDENRDNFPGVGRLRLDAVRGLNPDENMVITIPRADDPDKKDLHLFKNPSEKVALNLPGTGINILTNGYQINYSVPALQNVQIKTYGVKSGLSAMFCYVHENILVPYAKAKIGKNAKSFLVPTPPAYYTAKLDSICTPLDYEDFLILYPQIKTYFTLTPTSRVKDVVAAFVNRAKTVEDTHHLVKIDEVLMRVLSHV